MIRYLVVVAVMLTVFGCRQQSPATAPAATSQGRAAPNNPSNVPLDSFRLAIDDMGPDVRSDVDTGKRVFTISVPSSARRVRVLMGPVEQATSWSLNLEPSSEAERICMFEVSQPVVEQKDSSRYVTVTCKLTTPKSTSESPLGFTADETTKIDEVVSYTDSAKAGLHKMNTGVVLGHLKLGTPEAASLTLFVTDEHTDPKP